MPRVDVSDYEITHNLLPFVCARCGAPAAERVVSAVRILDGWRGSFQLFGVLFGLFFFPPLLVFAVRFARKFEVRIPMCAEHRNEFQQRDRMEYRVLLPAWTVAA